MRLLEGIGVGLMMFYLAVILCAIGFSIYGIYIAFCASIIMGIICFFTPPSGLIVGLVYFVWGKDIPQLIVNWLSN
jgi:hypothetical protein